MLNKKLLKSGASAVYGGALLGSVGVISGSIDLGSAWSAQISEQAPLVALGALAVAVILHGPSLGRMEKPEMLLGVASIGIPLVIYLGEPAAVVDMIGTSSNNHPWTSLLAATLSYAGAWVLTWR